MSHQARLCVAAVAAVLVVLALPAFSQQKPTAAEQTLIDAANRDRKARGLQPLRWDRALAQDARLHAARMAKENTISHQFRGEPDFAARARKAGASFTALAENVAEGPSVPGIHRQWMDSPHHRENLLDPELNAIGIGISQRGGLIFAAEVMSKTDRVLLADAEATFEKYEADVAALLQKLGLSIFFNKDDARRTCALAQGYKAERRPLYFQRFDAEIASQLPDDLQQQAQSGRYRSAAVGACSGQPSGLARIAVLLY